MFRLNILFQLDAFKMISTADPFDKHQINAHSTERIPVF